MIAGSWLEDSSRTAFLVPGLHHPGALSVRVVSPSGSGQAECYYPCDLRGGPYSVGVVRDRIGGLRPRVVSSRGPTS